MHTDESVRISDVRGHWEARRQVFFLYISTEYFWFRRPFGGSWETSFTNRKLSFRPVGFNLKSYFSVQQWQYLSWAPSRKLGSIKEWRNQSLLIHKPRRNYPNFRVAYCGLVKNSTGKQTTGRGDGVRKSYAVHLRFAMVISIPVHDDVSSSCSPLVPNSLEQCFRGIGGGIHMEYCWAMRRV